uniref:Acetyltransferase n=1 Tax=viral metagenome TaxID=1070528 RepID=A0A6M3J7Z1_9ZZZZ
MVTEVAQGLPPIMRLRLFPATLKQANEMIELFHRHHKRAVGHRFSIGCKDQSGIIHGIAVVGRPVGREVPQYTVAEVTRLVSDGTPHVCSKLYSACARAAKAMGYDWIQTAILVDEPGTSLIAAGWEFDHIIKGRNWNCPSRGGRRTDQPMCDKQLYKRNLNGN